jgi:hypothetical protein
MSEIDNGEDSGISTPIQSFITYFNSIKPYHSKILEILEQYNFVDPDVDTGREEDAGVQLLVSFGESMISDLLTPTVTPVPSNTPTMTPTISVTATVTPTSSVTPIPASPTPTASFTPTATPPSTAAAPTPSATPSLWPPWDSENNGSVNTAFSAPGALPTGLAFDGDNLISLDYLGAIVYFHNGISSTITNSIDISSFVGNPCDVTWDGTNVWIIDNAAITQLVGKTAVLATSFAIPSPLVGAGQRGLTYDGTNLISSDGNPDEIYVHSGLTSTITATLAAPDTGLKGLSYKNGNLLSIGFHSGEKVYVHVGVSATISTSFDLDTAATPYGISWVGTNIVTNDYTTDLIYIHNGLAPWAGIVPSITPTTTLIPPTPTPTPTNWPSWDAENNGTPNTSFASLSSDIGALAFDGDNLISVDSAANLFTRHSGISSSVLTTFVASLSGNVTDVAFDGTDIWTLTDSSIIYQLTGTTSGTIQTSFSSPFGARGLTFDGSNLVTIKYLPNTVYKHTGKTSTIQETITLTAIDTSLVPEGLDFASNNLLITTRDERCFEMNGVSDTLVSSFQLPAYASYTSTYVGTNMVVASTWADRTYTLPGLSASQEEPAPPVGGWPTWGAENNGSVNTSFSAPSTSPMGMCFDGDNLITGNSTTGIITFHVGVTSSTSGSINVNSIITGDLMDIEWDGTDLWVLDQYGGIRQLVGKTAVEGANIFSAVGSGSSSLYRGLAFDGTNFITSDGVGDLIRVHNGKSSTYTSQFAAPNLLGRGLTYKSGNLISVDALADKVYVHLGTTAAISTSFATPAISVSGVAYVGTNLVTCDVGTDDIYIHNGLTAFVP